MGLTTYRSTFFTTIMVIILAGITLSFSKKNDDKEAIKKVFTGVSDAWEQADGEAFGSYFTEDADFTVWFGLNLNGQREIAEGHQWVFETVYPNTRYEFDIAKLKLLEPNVAIVHLNASIIAPGEDLPEDPHTFPVAVLQKNNNQWKIVMFHNMKNQIKEMEERRSKGDMGDVRH